ncbi:helix-turn-helix transcriptional regulator [Pseudarthrobacter sp. TAF60_1]|uniref:helix-turn-helix transcriptional regulator n=1 Tax=Pseudarthrobacter sp. TAF60_1 TaxID=3233071 RepID=UPI003F958B1A
MEALKDLLSTEVRARRVQLGLTQRDLADMAGVSERFVRFVEQGKPSIQLDSLTAVLDTLGIELRLTTRTSQAARAINDAAAPNTGEAQS